MKLLFAEAGHNYKEYLFPYQILLWREAEEEAAEAEKIYSMGFLPFRHRANLFYLARSSRCNLSRFAPTSENRRILKKTAGLSVEKYSANKFSYSPAVQKTCREWAKKREWVISTGSLKYLFSGKFFNWVWRWQEQKTGKTVGYQIIYEERKIIHTAHVFYDSEYFKMGLGMRMLLEATLWAKQEEKKFHYLGTCYGKTGFYKRDLSGFEFFNGFRWSNDLAELNYLNERQGKDYLLRDKEYLDIFWGGKIEDILEI